MSGLLGHPERGSDLLPRRAFATSIGNAQRRFSGEHALHLGRLLKGSLGRTKSGRPRHPLYVPAETRPTVFHHPAALQ